jgi:hypothetical protein
MRISLWELAGLLALLSGAFGIWLRFVETRKKE